MTARKPWETDHFNDEKPAEKRERPDVLRETRSSVPERGEAASQALEVFRREYERKLAEAREREASE